MNPDQGYAMQASLKKMLEDYLRGHWKIKTARYFVSEKEVEWIALHKLIRNSLRDQGHTKELEIEWERIGLDLVAIFKHGRIFSQTIAIAMLPQAIEGKWVFGYFSLVEVE
ncbi:MAG: hypothetical protein KDK66_02485 [Deltaproteobacteria bacterium]|nr:hypothetical protein [Deltaproteobacteria bacterium]